ncbi:flagellar hook-associated protein FlgL [Musicola keenii]|uniref:flagellar hook-associated protein FlgL n=1 Tax=Musicola keenii TaxID=2884250 RepID=UPI00177F8CDA|nr:flagellar hook-associated protein FlgL [Musicola keenii]
MRLSTAIIYKQNQQSVSNSYSRYQESSVQLSNLQKVNSPSDDPVASAQAVILAQTQASSAQYATSRSSASNSLKLETTTLDQVTDVIQNIQTLIVEAGDTTYSDTDRQSLKTELQGYKDQLLGLANSTDSNGNYIFAGYKTGSAPFSEDTTSDPSVISYVGSDTAISQKVDASRTMTVGDTGDDVFGDIFTHINNVLDALDISLDDTNGDNTNMDTYTAALGTATTGMSDSLDDVLTIQASVGSKINELDTLDSAGDSKDLIYSDLMTSLKGADATDWYDIISENTLRKATLQAAYTAFSSMQSLSLFEMNS